MPKPRVFLTREQKRTLFDEAIAVIKSRRAEQSVSDRNYITQKEAAEAMHALCMEKEWGAPTPLTFVDFIRTLDAPTKRASGLHEYLTKYGEGAYSGRRRGVGNGFEKGLPQGFNLEAEREKTARLADAVKEQYRQAIEGLSSGERTIESLAAARGQEQWVVRSFLRQNPDIAELLER